MLIFSPSYSYAHSAPYRLQMEQLHAVAEAGMPSNAQPVFPQ